MPLRRQKRFPETSVILLAILLAVMVATWLVPAVSYNTVEDGAGRTTIDEASVTISRANPIYPWQLPGLLVDGVESVITTLILISVSNGTFAVLNASGMFSALIVPEVSASGSKADFHNLHRFFRFRADCNPPLFHRICTPGGSVSCPIGI